MTYTMYDAVRAATIPATATMVAGYGDTIHIPQWTAAEWARFAHAIRVVIVKKATSHFGDVLDVETGDATPAEAPGWVAARRAVGADPTVYCNASTWPDVKAAMAAAHVPPPHYWIAEYDGNPTIPVGAIAKQYRNTTAYDLSVVADSAPWVPTTRQEDDMATTDPLPGTRPDGTTPTLGEAVVASYLAEFYPEPANGGKSTQTKLDTLLTQVAAIQGALPQLEADILGAVKALPAGAAPTDAQMAALTAALEAALPTYTVQIAPKPANPATPVT